MQTLHYRNSRLKQIHLKEIYGGYFAAVPSGGGGEFGSKGRLDFGKCIFFFTFQTAISIGAFRVANDLLIGDASIRVINNQAYTNYWSSNLGFNQKSPRFSSADNWESVLEQNESAERMFQFHRIIENKISSDTDPEPNRSLIFTENRILLNNAEG